MKRKLELIIMMFLLLAILVMSGCGSKIPHEVSGRGNCLQCHASNGIEPYPDGHAQKNLGNNDCMGCHTVAENYKQMRL